MSDQRKIITAFALVVLLPMTGHAQVAEKIESLHSVLDTLYTEMMPMCEDLLNVARGLAGFGALWYVCSRVWRHLANAEAIDFYPLFRPFVLGFCISIFPAVLTMINGLMKPVVTGTAAMVKKSDLAITQLLNKKEEAIKSSAVWQMYVGQDGDGDRDKWYRYTYDGEDPANEGMFDSVGNHVSFSLAKATYRFKNSVKEWMSEILKILFQAASLCINTLRTFQLVVLSVLGPLVFGLAVFDGFQQTLSSWLSRYLNVFLWLPVANIFGAIIGKIQENMLKLDLDQIKEQGDTFFSATDTGYLIFMLIGIVGYFTVPSVANFIVNAGQGSAMVQKMTSMLSSTANTSSAIAGGMGVQAASGAYNIANAGRFMNQGYESKGRMDGRFEGEGASGAIGRAAGSYLGSRLSGEEKKK